MSYMNFMKAESTSSYEYSQQEEKGLGFIEGWLNSNDHAGSVICALAINTGKHMESVACGRNISVIRDVART